MFQLRVLSKKKFRELKTFFILDKDVLSYLSKFACEGGVYKCKILRYLFYSIINNQMGNYLFKNQDNCGIEMIRISEVPVSSGAPIVQIMNRNNYAMSGNNYAMGDTREKRSISDDSNDLDNSYSGLGLGLDFVFVFNSLTSLIFTNRR
jgi:hypothetical protein